ncbi:MAG TPA: class I SAM-dependent methyltransferase [Pirellulales bacterium]|jgi:23S rRNA (cytosine1962-C5)-methyltransferase|nr:class I SAM-dependent methyltransferase [Pirellulales bacterium]
MFTPDQYALLDYGNGRKLERFGQVLVDRPAPAAEGLAPQDPPLWRMAAARYERTAGDRGKWRWHGILPEPWTVAHGGVTLELKPTPFGHLGLFPEQAANWDWIARRTARAPKPIKLLNLFAYTGAATLAAAGVGAEVTHVDAARNTVAWARRNAHRSGLAAAPIRWIVDDARTFVGRELKRGNRYHAVVLDPPSYGHGPNGKVWLLEWKLLELLTLCFELISTEPRFVLLSCHSPGFDAPRLAEVLSSATPDGAIEALDMEIHTTAQRSLSSGASARWTTA